MNSTKRTWCFGLFHALFVLHCIGVTEGFGVIKNHQREFRLAYRQLSSSRRLSKIDTDYKLNTLSGPFESNTESDHSGEDASVADRTRRRGGSLLLQSILIGGLPLKLCSQTAHADDATSNETIFVSGKVNLPPGTTDLGTDAINNNSGATPTKPALYVTVRPNRPDNVPRAILDGSRGKPPPILAARFESPVFPFDFGLSEKDLTPEGLDKKEEGNGYWWSSDDLIVSARWDSDGVAATRSPEDLVGRNLWKRGTADGFVLDLQGRGSFGKFATKKN